MGSPACSSYYQCVREWLPFSQSSQGFDHILIRTSSAAAHLITTDKLRRGDSAQNLSNFAMNAKDGKHD